MNIQLNTKSTTDNFEQQENSSKLSNTDSDKAKDLETEKTVDFIRVVDNITTNKHQLRNSVSIKKVLNKATTEKIDIKHTYTLPKGGVAFHFKSQEDTNKFDKEVNKVFPGSTCNTPESLQNHKNFIIKDIESFISLRELTSSLQQIVQGRFYVRRFFSTRTRKPLPIICVTCESTTCDNFLHTGIELFGSHFNCEKYIKPVQ